MSSLVCVTGSKGAPGATTLALTLALTGTPTTDRSVVLVDADSDGGDLAALLRVPTNPGLVTLAAATRHMFTREEIDRHLQPVAVNVELLAAPPSAEQASSTLVALGEAFSASLAASTAVADLGRWRPASPAAALVRAASTTVLVVHPTVAGVAHARAAFDDLANRSRHVVVVTRGERPYGPDDVAAALGAQDVVAIPVDRTGASLLAGGVAERWLRRSALARTARSLGSRLWTDPTAAPSVEVSA